MMEPLYIQGFRTAQSKSANLAKEADEIMTEMVEFLQCCNFDNNTDMREADALVRKYKEMDR